MPLKESAVMPAASGGAEEAVRSFSEVTEPVRHPNIQPKISPHVQNGKTLSGLSSGANGIHVLSSSFP